MFNKFFTVALIIKHDNGTKTEVPTKFPSDTWTYNQAFDYVKRQAERIGVKNFYIEFQDNQELTNHSHEWPDA